MKTLIVYATAGAGHRRVAEAIYERAKRQGQDVVIADILDYTNPLFRFFYARGYIFLIRYFPFVWRFVFWLTDKKGLGLIRKAIFLFNLISCVGYLRSLRREKYSCVISTHFMATEMSAFAAGDLGFSLINVVTDFSLHRFWLSPGVDKYCLACPDAKDRLVSYGVPADKIVITGIPVAEKFLSVSDKAGLRKRLGLESGLFSVLIMTGEVGMGPIDKKSNVYFRVHGP
ncbi:MAG: hypothetical protein ACE5GG_05170, partial [Candidatus Omnitrophota bacterium]